MLPTLSRSSRSPRWNITVSYDCRFSYFPVLVRLVFYINCISESNTAWTEHTCDVRTIEKTWLFYIGYLLIHVTSSLVLPSLPPLVSSQGSGLWESVPAGYPAVSASLLSDSGPLEACLWSSVQPHNVWTAKGIRLHKHLSCITNRGSSLQHSSTYLLASNAQCKFFLCLQEFQEQMKGASFKDVVIRGKELSGALITALINIYIKDNASVDAISNHLRDICPLLYSTDDSVCSKVHRIQIQGVCISLQVLDIFTLVYLNLEGSSSG